MRGFLLCFVLLVGCSQNGTSETATTQVDTRLQEAEQDLALAQSQVSDLSAENRRLETEVRSLREKAERDEARVSSLFAQVRDLRSALFEWRQYARELENSNYQFDPPSMACIVDPSDC